MATYLQNLTRNERETSQNVRMSVLYHRGETASCVGEVVLWENLAQMGARMRRGHLIASTGLPKKGNTKMILTLLFKKENLQHIGSF